MGRSFSPANGIVSIGFCENGYHVWYQENATDTMHFVFRTAEELARHIASWEATAPKTCGFVHNSAGLA